MRPVLPSRRCPLVSEAKSYPVWKSRPKISRHFRARCRSCLTMDTSYSKEMRPYSVLTPSSKGTGRQWSSRCAKLHAGATTSQSSSLASYPPPEESSTGTLATTLSKPTISAMLWGRSGQRLEMEFLSLFLWITLGYTEQRPSKPWWPLLR